MINLLDENPDISNKKDEELVAHNRLENCVISNFVEQAALFEYASIGFGEETTYLI